MLVLIIAKNLRTRGAQIEFVAVLWSFSARFGKMLLRARAWNGATPLLSCCDSLIC
jgi:hypothetical protein